MTFFLIHVIFFGLGASVQKSDTPAVNVLKLNPFVHIEKRLVKKLRSISKFMTLETGKQIIAIHVLPNISRSKDNQAMKFRQLIEYNMKNSFLEN